MSVHLSSNFSPSGQNSRADHFLRDWTGSSCSDIPPASVKAGLTSLAHDYSARVLLQPSRYRLNDARDTGGAARHVKMMFVAICWICIKAHSPNRAETASTIRRASVYSGRSDHRSTTGARGWGHWSAFVHRAGGPHCNSRYDSSVNRSWKLSLENERMYIPATELWGDPRRWPWGSMHRFTAVLKLTRLC